MAIRWLTIFLDTPRGHPAAGPVADFWCAVTGGRLSPWRGERFVTVLPVDGDAALRLQLTEDGGPGGHLDLHVDEPAVVVSALLDRGAQLLDDTYDDVTVLASPAGIVFCVVAADPGCRVSPPQVVGGVASALDQLCLDVPAELFEAETRWWQAATGWELRRGSRPEFVVLERPPGVSLRILLQRIDDGLPGVHPDFSSSDRQATVDTHVRLGATRLREGVHWTVLADPVGRAYCVTDRDPATGRLPPGG